MNATTEIELHAACLHELARTDERGDFRVARVECGQRFFQQVESFKFFLSRKSHAVDNLEEQRRVGQPLQIFCQPVIKI